MVMSFSSNPILVKYDTAASSPSSTTDSFNDKNRVALINATCVEFTAKARREISIKENSRPRKIGSTIAISTVVTPRRRRLFLILIGMSLVGQGGGCLGRVVDACYSTRLTESNARIRLKASSSCVVLSACKSMPPPASATDCSCDKPFTSPAK